MFHWRREIIHASCGNIYTIFATGYLFKSRTADPYKASNKYLEHLYLLQAFGVVVESRPELSAPSFTLFQLIPNTSSLLIGGQTHLASEQKAKMTMPSYMKVSQSQEDLSAEEYGEQRDLLLGGMNNIYIPRLCCQTPLPTAISIAIFGGVCLLFAASLTILAPSDRKCAMQLSSYCGFYVGSE